MVSGILYKGQLYPTEKNDVQLAPILTQHSYGSQNVIHVLDNSCIFMIITEFCGHMIINYDFPSWLQINKINGEARRQQVMVTW